jgi:hypothetical protein
MVAMATLLQSARMDTMAITHMRVRLTATTDRRGLAADSLSVLAPGTVVATTVIAVVGDTDTAADTAIVAVSAMAIGAVTGTVAATEVGTAGAMVAAIAEPPLADSTAAAAVEASMAVAVVDSTVAAATAVVDTDNNS